MNKIQRYSDGCFQQPNETPVVGFAEKSPYEDFVSMEVTGAESMLRFDPRATNDEYENE